ncbi:MAG: DNA cytosine methyltransferase [Nitrosopumilaceae archaeon]|nr:DNA cytosine methyltransferase [Nitrosopumilaceae archaeon]
MGKKPLAVDAFCGAGGMSYGLMRSGFNICYAFDNDDRAIASYASNVDAACAPRDAYDIDLRRVLRSRGIDLGSVALVAGGPPCQGFSVQRRGDDADPRNDLVRVFFDMAFTVNPTFVLMENVLGMRGDRGKSLMQYVRDECGRRGYFFHTRELNAADFGAPQIRRRFFIVAEKIEGGKPHFHFPEPQYGSGEYRTVRDAIADLPSPPSDGSEHALIPNHRSDVLSERNRRRFMHVPQDGGRDNIPFGMRLNCHKISTERAGHRYVYGRLSWKKPSGVITARFDSLTRGRFGHPEENRSLSLREGARLQTFPDSFVFQGSKIEVARQIGNAVPPVLAESLGRSIIKSLKHAGAPHRA